MHNIPWRLSEIERVRKNGLKVFSIFACGGGSTMGYKLSGYDVIGFCEIDQRMAEIYEVNNRPKHKYIMSIQQFNQLKELPIDLYNLDILDGSPPCSSFSMTGAREKYWGKEKTFREGQSKQVLDDLFFSFIETANKLRPKIIVSENVKGLIMGNAKGYVKEIFNRLRNIGYETQLFLLNSSRMGVPQTRERVFFISRRLDLNIPKLILAFNENKIPLADAWTDLINETGRPLSKAAEQKWKRTLRGDSFARTNGTWFSFRRLSMSAPASTLTANGQICHPDKPRYLSRLELCRIQSFPDDYNFLDQNPFYVCGMSVPPLMMERLSLEIFRQCFQ